MTKIKIVTPEALSDYSRNNNGEHNSLPNCAEGSSPQFLNSKSDSGNRSIKSCCHTGGGSSDQKSLKFNMRNVTSNPSPDPSKTGRSYLNRGPLTSDGGATKNAHAGRKNFNNGSS